MFGPKDLDFCFFDKCLGGVAQSTSGLLRRVTPALLRSLATKKPADVLPYSVCVAEDPANGAREEKKRFRSRQTASKQGTNHSDSYSRRIDLPRSNAVAREAWTFAYVPFQFALHQNSSSCEDYLREKQILFFFFFLTEGLKNRQSVSAGSRETETNMLACVEDRWRENNGQENCLREKKERNHE